MGRAAAESHPTQKDVAMVNMQPQEQRRAKKVLKPALEKRRRDRINESLEKLRILLLESTRNRKFLNPKIEKVEILETAVQYLKKRTQMMKDGTLSGRHYLSGYKDCEQRLANFIDKVHPSDKNHFLTDLQMCVQSNYWRASDLGLLATSQENYHMLHAEILGQYIYELLDAKPELAVDVTRGMEPEANGVMFPYSPKSLLVT
ncbi:hypothetical protein NDU88_004642 [Pleurodeles waltl]|uniref:BHLH domain-containing protein n=1 Tax=Pleurodeles waltl TaxID=8319 RepID=A0AAV7KYZ8_PLEWA|nr:hypothetical protein NDU88_004642 [Pleurodeles waltl]